jgi:arsenate reductase (thioredoxin)
MKIYIFACVHNAGRSQMACAFFNQFADPKLASALSAGTAPVAQVHPEVVRVMREEGIDLAKAQPQKLTHELVEGASALITIGCGEDWPPVPGLKRIDWPIEGPRAKDIPTVRTIRDSIKQHVLDLVRTEKLARKYSTGSQPVTIEAE